MASTSNDNMYINPEAFNILVKASTVVSCQLVAVAEFYYLNDNRDMASSGSAGYVRGRAGGFRAPRDRAADDTNNGDREIFRLTPDDYEKIVSYLEIPENFAAIVGGGRRIVVGKKYGSKATVFKAMLAAIQHHGFPQQIIAANLQKRFQRFVKKYKDAREFKLDTGGGLTDEEIEIGLTLEDKLDRICPHFERMHALYNQRPNMSPPVLGDVGVEEDEISQTQNVDENGDVDDNSLTEKTNPNLPTDFEEDGTPRSQQAGVPNTPSTLRNANINKAFWAEMEELAHEQHNGMAVHAMSCQCNECRNFAGVHTGESRPDPTETCGDTQPPSQRSMSPNGPTPPTPLSKKATKTPNQAGKDVAATSKSSFTTIYADRIKEKADYHKELIQSRDKWKALDLDERRQARLETLEQELKKARLERKHQLQLESAVAANALKRARVEFEHAVTISNSKLTAEQDHEKEMAKVARKTALLTTLFGSSKTPTKIKDLLPIIDTTE